MIRHALQSIALICALSLAQAAAAEAAVDNEAETAATEVAPSAPAAHSRLPRHCLGRTGTRIPQAQARCSVGGRVYTREDLERSGGMDIGDSLRRLDPRIGSGWR